MWKNQKLFKIVIVSYIMVKRKREDFVKESCTNPILLLAIAIVIVSYFFEDPIKQYIQVFFFFFISWSCFKNYRQCGRIHCKYTGPGFLIVAIIAFLVVLNIINIPWLLTSYFSNWVNFAAQQWAYINRFCETMSTCSAKNESGSVCTYYWFIA